jgi:hypothetical protein
LWSFILFVIRTTIFILSEEVLNYFHRRWHKVSDCVCMNHQKLLSMLNIFVVKVVYGHCNSLWTRPAWERFCRIKLHHQIDKLCLFHPLTCQVTVIYENVRDRGKKLQNGNNLKNFLPQFCFEGRVYGFKLVKNSFWGCAAELMRFT